jgi:hypothetical protein
MKSGNRKQRNKVFKSIHNGDFGDDWDIGKSICEFCYSSRLISPSL